MWIQTEITGELPYQKHPLSLGDLVSVISSLKEEYPQIMNVDLNGLVINSDVTFNYKAGNGRVTFILRKFTIGFDMCILVEIKLPGKLNQYRRFTWRDE